MSHCGRQEIGNVVPPCSGLVDVAGKTKPQKSKRMLPSNIPEHGAVPKKLKDMQHDAIAAAVGDSTKVKQEDENRDETNGTGQPKQDNRTPAVTSSDTDTAPLTSGDLVIKFKYWDSELLVTSNDGQAPRRVRFCDVWNASPKLRTKLLEDCHEYDKQNIKEEFVAVRTIPDAIEPSILGYTESPRNLDSRHGYSKPQQHNAHTVFQIEGASAEDFALIEKYYNQTILVSDTNSPRREIVTVGWFWETMPEARVSIITAVRKYEQRLKILGESQRKHNEAAVSGAVLEQR